MQRESNRLKLSLITTLLLVSYAILNAQTFSDDEIIDITGLNYGRLQVFILAETSSEFPKTDRDRIVGLVHRNILWSGYFDIKQEFDPWDIKIVIGFPENTRISAKIVSTDDNLLFEKSETITPTNDIEEATINLVSSLVRQLTGEKSIFKSAIVYVQKTESGSYQFVLTDAFGKTSRVILDDGNINILPRWNPDATAILFTSLSRKGSVIKRLQLKTGKVEVLFEKIGRLSGGTWGPDGNELIMTLSKKGNSDLFRLDAKGNILEQLTFRSSSESNPRWSPDGRRLLYVSNRSGGVQIYQRDMKYKDSFRMTFEGSYNVEPCWSNDGNSIVYAGIENGRYYLFIMDRDGDYSRKLTRTDTSAEQPIWAPNGRQIIYVSKLANDQKLFMIRSDGTYRRRLTTSKKGVSEFNPSWTGIYQWKE